MIKKLTARRILFGGTCKYWGGLHRAGVVIGVGRLAGGAANGREEGQEFLAEGGA